MTDEAIKDEGRFSAILGLFSGKTALKPFNEIAKAGKTSNPVLNALSTPHAGRLA